MLKSELSKLRPEDLAAAIPALDSLRKEYEERLVTVYNDSLASRNYDNPNWAYIQADMNGRLSEIKRLLKLISTKDK